MLSVRGLAKSFAGSRARRVFSDVSLELGRGEFVAITGESGVGKSTLLNLIAGLDVPDAGSVLLEGVQLTSLPDVERTRLRRKRMSFVFQAFHVLPYLTIAENVALPLALTGVAGSGRVERVGQMLAAVGLAEHAGSPPRTLSGGELQRVAIARALVHSPALVLADEPTGNLDPESAAQAIGVLRRSLAGTRAGCLLVTHSPLAAAAADRVLRLTATGMEDVRA